MAGFIGEFHCTVDAKGRFLLPGGLKKQIAVKENKFFLLLRSCNGFYLKQVLYRKLFNLTMQGTGLRRNLVKSGLIRTFFYYFF